MSEMNTPKDSRTGLSEKLDGILSKDPTNALASALKEALSDLSAEKAEQILNRLNNELPTGKIEGGAGSAAAEVQLSPQVERWIRALKENSDPELKKAAACILGEREDPSAVPALIEALKDESRSVRWRAAEALGKIKDPSAVPQLIEALKDGDKYVRLSAAEALGEIGDPRAVPALLGALNLDIKLAVRDSAAQALVSIGTPAVPALCDVLKDKNSYVRQEAAWALGEIGDPRAVHALCEALKDGDFVVPYCAAQALGEIGDKSAITPLKARLPFLGIFGGEKNRDVREAIEDAITTLEKK